MTPTTTAFLTLAPLVALLIGHAVGTYLRELSRNQTRAVDWLSDAMSEPWSL